MQAEKTTGETLNVSREKLTAFVSEMLGGTSIGREDDEHPLPPGPWDPIIRKVSKQVFYPSDRFKLAALNPQPLPPQAAFLAAVAEEVVDRALLMQEIGDAMSQTGEQQSIIIVGGKLSQFVDGIDELCPRISRKFPKPKGGDSVRFSALELLAAGAVFEQNAASVGNENLQQELRTVGARLIEMSIERM